jgi:hypothetical protein
MRVVLNRGSAPHPGSHHPTTHSPRRRDPGSARVGPGLARHARRTPILGACRLLAFAAAVLVSGPASAQVDTGTILGTIKDQSGAVLPGATVTITHEAQALALTTVTREDGTYIFTPIRTGAYAIDVEFPGFKKGATGHHRRHPAAGGRRLLARAGRRQ